METFNPQPKGKTKMSAQQKDDIFALSENLQETQKKLQEFGKEQSAFLTSLVEKNMNFQKEQYDLWSKIIQNQVAHKNKILQDYVKIAGDSVKKASPSK